MYVCVHAQLCLTAQYPVDCSPPGSSVHEILQARILEWVAIPSSADLPNPEIVSASLASPALAGRFFTTVPPGKTLILKQFFEKLKEKYMPNLNIP